MRIKNKEDFSISGPHHLTRPVDWTSEDECRSIAASLVNGVYLLERFRQKKRQGQQQTLLISNWWEHFQFELTETHKDEVDDSIFAATFEYTGNDSTPNHPRYVLAFRGTVIKLKNLIRDLELDVRVAGHRTLGKDQRYKTALNVLQKTPLCDINPRQIWLAGHSLGATLALRLGKTMAQRGSYVESYLFNPPFPSGPVEQINEGILKKPIHVFHKLFITFLSTIVKDSSSLQEDIDTFLGLNEWTPRLFVHPRDLICSGYIGYFESRRVMNSIGLDCVNRVSSSSSFINLVAEAMGRGGEATHLIPSAYVIKNISSNAKLLKAHKIDKWWQPQLHCESNQYCLHK